MTTLTAKEQYTALSRAMADDPSRFAAASEDSALARAALSEVGLDVPEGVEIRLHRNDSRELHFAIPSNPNAELGEESMGRVAGGSGPPLRPSSASTFVSCVSTAACDRNW